MMKWIFLPTAQKGQKGLHCSVTALQMAAKFDTKKVLYTMYHGDAKFHTGINGVSDRNDNMFHTKSVLQVRLYTPLGDCTDQVKIRSTQFGATASMWSEKLSETSQD